MLRTVVLTFLMGVGYYLIRNFLAALFLHYKKKMGTVKGPETQGQMVRDPACGLYIPEATAVQGRMGGQVQYFCSTKCRDAYKQGAHQKTGSDPEDS